MKGLEDLFLGVFLVFFAGLLVFLADLSLTEWLLPFLAGGNFTMGIFRLSQFIGKQEML